MPKKPFEVKLVVKAETEDEARSLVLDAVRYYYTMKVMNEPVNELDQARA